MWTLEYIEEKNSIEELILLFFKVTQIAFIYADYVEFCEHNT